MRHEDRCGISRNTGESCCVRDRGESGESRKMKVRILSLGLLKVSTTEAVT